MTSGHTSLDHQHAVILQNYYTRVGRLVACPRFYVLS